MIYTPQPDTVVDVEDEHTFTNKLLYRSFWASGDWRIYSTKEIWGRWPPKYLISSLNQMILISYEILRYFTNTRPSPPN